MADGAAAKAKVMHMEEAFWELPPGHFQAFSKLLVRPTNAATIGRGGTPRSTSTRWPRTSPPADMPAVPQTGGRDVQAPSA